MNSDRFAKVCELHYDWMRQLARPPERPLTKTDGRRRFRRGFTLDNVLRIFASIGKFLRREFAAALPVFLFFVVGFLFLLLFIKLALANFSIEMTALSKAVIGALFAAQAVLILDETPLARRLEHHRRIIAVAVKTLLYGAITLLLGYLERFLDALRRVHSFDAAVRYMIDQANIYRALLGAGSKPRVRALLRVVRDRQTHGRGGASETFF